MARRASPSLCSISSLLLPRSADSLYHLVALLTIFSLFLNHLARAALVSAAAADSHFEGFDAEEDDEAQADESDDLESLRLANLKSTPLTTSSDPESHHGPPIVSDPVAAVDEGAATAGDVKEAVVKSVGTSRFDFWDEDEFEGLPAVEENQQQAEDEVDAPKVAEAVIPPDQNATEKAGGGRFVKQQSYMVEIVCGSFLIIFLINYFTGKKENEKIALAWAARFATRDSIFAKNFSLLGVGEGEDSPLLLKEGQTIFKFYASGRRYCQGLLATIELKSRHDLISRLYNMVVPNKDEISFEVYMNDDAMDQVIFAMAKKKAAKVMQKELVDLQRFAALVSPPNGRKWAPDELGVVSESKEVAGDLITDIVLDQVFGEKAFEKYGKGFISMHFSDQHPGTHRKMLQFKFALPDANNMADMTRLIALIPYYIDLIGKYKLSSQARSKTETARAKAAQEAYKELQNARQEALQQKKAEKKKLMEEAAAKLSAEALRKREAKERARQMKKAMPKVKMSRGH
uniref:Coiled-coil domain-containing protein 47 n=1 Tax=Kalanchoe fedtschenkoi TaxID=63787 RepID=A0A7N0RGU0_KALFE